MQPYEKKGFAQNPTEVICMDPIASIGFIYRAFLLKSAPGGPTGRLIGHAG
ncbi:hypothetical protein GN316_14590 [Xylophilus sp. Kf1]|nr:hypothetical protein [Xylophilus sp. Kf1]